MNVDTIVDNIIKHVDIAVDNRIKDYAKTTGVDVKDLALLEQHNPDGIVYYVMQKKDCKAKIGEKENLAKAHMIYRLNYDVGR